MRPTWEGPLGHGEEFFRLLVTHHDLDLGCAIGCEYVGALLAKVIVASCHVWSFISLPVFLIEFHASKIISGAKIQASRVLARVRAIKCQLTTVCVGESFTL